MKKLVSMLVVLAMVLSMVPVVSAAEAATSGTIEAVSGTPYTTDIWTAESDGVLTISVSSEEGVGYKVYVNGEAQSLMWAMTYAETIPCTVVAGDTVYLEVQGYNPDTWAYCDATIHWAYSFDADGVVKDAYAVSEQTIAAVGDTAVTMIGTAEVTVVTIAPEEAGVYTITVGDGATVGNCGSTSALISTDVEFGSSVEWTCKQAGYWTETEIPAEDFQESGEYITIEQYISGQSLMLGIISDSETVTVNVEKTADYVAPTTTEVVYVNKATLTQFAVPADATIGSYVDVYGDTHTAVLGSDGYYHLDSADGDILLVDMNYIATLSDALNSERPVMYAYVTGEDGNTTRYDIGNAVQAYEAVCDENGYYPLTEDLIFFYDTYAGGAGVYQYCLSANYNPECAWMFACLTMSLPEEGSALEGSGTEADPYIITSLPADLTMDVPGGGGVGQVFYLYVAEQDGTIEIKDLYDNLYPGSIWLYVNGGDPIWLNEGGIGAVEEGDSVLIEHYQSNWGAEAITCELTLQFASGSGSEGGGESGGDEGGGDTGDDNTGDDTTVETVTEETTWSGTDVAVTPSEPVTIRFTAGVDGTLTGTISAENTGWEFDIVDADESYMSTVWSDSTPNTINESLTEGTTYTITIYGYDEASWDIIDSVITYALTFTPAGSGADVAGSGTEEDPYQLIVNGDNYASIPEGEGEIVYFIWVATADGTLTLTFDETDPQPWVTPYIGGVTAATGSGDYVQEYAVTEGTTVMLAVETYDWVAADYTFYVSFTAGSADVEATELFDGDNDLTIYAGEGATPYTYTATQTGTLYLTFTTFGYNSTWGYSDCSDYIADYFGTVDGWDNWMKLTINGQAADTYYGSVEVTEGDVVAIGWEYHGANDYVQSNYDLFGTLNLNYDGFLIPEPGSIDAPYTFTKDGVDAGISVTDWVQPGVPTYFELVYFDSSTITVTGQGDFTVSVLSYETDENWETVEKWTDYQAVDGVVEFYADGYSILVSIENNGDAAAVYEFGYYYPVGHPLEPQVITGEGTWTAELAANSNGYYYSWSMGDDTKSGMMTITVNGASWQYYVSNDTQYASGDYHYSSDKPPVSTEEWTVFAGDVFTIWVSTNYNDAEGNDYDTPEGSVTISISFEEKELVQGVDYPYAVSYYDGPSQVTVGAGEEVWVELSGFSGYYAVVTGEGAYIIYNGTTYTAENGVLQVMIDDYTADITLGNSSGAEVTYTIQGEAPLGHSQNPQIITGDGTYTTSAFPDNGFSNYYFQYTAEEAGTITVEVLNETNWRVQIWNPENYKSSGGNSNSSTNVFTLDVEAGDVIQIYGAPYDPKSYQVVSGTLSFQFSFEASQEVVEALPLYDGDNAVVVDNVDGTLTASHYTYTATQTGTLYLTFSDVIYWTSYNGELGDATEGSKSTIVNNTKVTVNGEELANGYYGAIEVTAGDVVTVTWNIKYAAYQWKVTANLNLNYEGYNPAPGSEADPVDLYSYECPAETVEIAAGGSAYYNLKGFYGQIITVTGEGAYIVYNGQTHTDEDGDGVVKLVADDTGMAVQIGNSSSAPAVFTIGYEYPVGTQGNPEKVEEGEHEITVEENDDNYYVSFTTECAGVLEITFSGDNWQYMIYNETTGEFFYDGAWTSWGSWTYSTDFTDTTVTVEVDVLENEVISIGVNTIFVSDDWDGLYGSSPAGTITVDIAAKYDHLDDDKNGVCDICGHEMEAVDVLYGDVDGDGDVDIMDANLAVSYYNEITELTEDQLLAADVDGDGDVDIMDANLIVAYYNEVRDSFPVEE